MNIAVVDDNRQESTLLIQLIRQYEKEYSLCIDISCFSDGSDFIASLNQND